jgi:hypothetical protein
VDHRGEPDVHSRSVHVWNGVNRLRDLVWYALIAMLLAAGGIAVAIWWPERSVLVLALGLAAVTTALLALRDVP